MPVVLPKQGDEPERSVATMTLLNSNAGDPIKQTGFCGREEILRD